jgi:sigma-B regulation protein RsbU (phosphoserine phosphatase)
MTATAGDDASEAPAAADDAEAARLAAVRRYDILDTPPDGSFDVITSLTARALGVPIAIVSIVDEDRIWFKSHHGLDVDEIGRDPGLCASAILQHDPYIVTDAAMDPRTLANPLVSGDFGLRFYTAIPLTVSSGHNLGTLCALDTHPREVSDAEVDTLRDLAAIVVNELELRMAANRTIAAERELVERSEQLAVALQQIALPETLPQVPGWQISATYVPATTARIGGDWYDAFHLDDHTIALTIGDVSGHGLPAATCMGQIRNAIRAYAHQAQPPDAIARDLSSLVHSLDGNHHATLAYFTIDTDSGTYRAVNAGHLPPMLVNDGSCQRIPWPPAPPVGMGIDHAYVSIEGTLGPGEHLVLYTDGLIERRGETIEDGIGRLAAVFAGAATHSQVMAAARSLFEDRALLDDVAIVVLSRS